MWDFLVFMWLLWCVPTCVCVSDAQRGVSVGRGSSMAVCYCLRKYRVTVRTVWTSRENMLLASDQRECSACYSLSVWRFTHPCRSQTFPWVCTLASDWVGWTQKVRMSWNETRIYIVKPPESHLPVFFLLQCLMMIYVWLIPQLSLTYLSNFLIST